MKQYVAKISYLLRRTVHHHQAFVMMAIVLAVLSVVLWRFYNLSTLPIDQAYVDNEVQRVKSVQFDSNAIKQMETLRDSNVKDPGVNISNNRQNPFTE